MTHFLRHQPCPNCGSSDARGIWSDGSQYCFSCKSYQPPTSLDSFTLKRKKATSSYIALPEDAIPYLPDFVKAWLNKYSLTDAEIKLINPLWSFSRSSLIFPVYANGVLLMYQERYFGEEKRPKYLTYGYKGDVMHLLGNHSESMVVITEDLISAVKVSTVMNSMPVWGSNLSLKDATRLSKRFKHLVLWLDMNKASDSLKMASKYAPLFDSSVSVVTELDPKEYSHDEIRDRIRIL